MNLHEKQEWPQCCLSYDNSRDVRVDRSLDPCSNGRGFETIFRPASKCEDRILGERREDRVVRGEFLFNSRAKGIMRCCHIERKDQGRTARLVYLSSVLFMLCSYINALKIVSVFAYQLLPLKELNHQLHEPIHNSFSP